MMGSMLPYIAAPWILWDIYNYNIYIYIYTSLDCNRWATSEFVLPAFDQCVWFLSIFVMECCFVVDCWTMGMSFYHLFDKMILWIWAVFKTPGWWLLPGIIIWLSNTNWGWTNHQWTGNPILNQSGNCQTCQVVQCLVPIESMYGIFTYIGIILNYFRGQCR